MVTAATVNDAIADVAAGARRRDGFIVLTAHGIVINTNAVATGVARRTHFSIRRNILLQQVAATIGDAVTRLNYSVAIGEVRSRNREMARFRYIVSVTVV